MQSPFTAKTKEKDTIIYNPEFLRRYSTDRKEGCVKRRSGGLAEIVGTTFEMVLCYVSKPFETQMFGQKDRITGQPITDMWVCLGFLDPNNTASVMMINNGKTENLRPLFEYLLDTEQDGYGYGELITTLGFRPYSSGLGYALTFKGREPKGKEESGRMQLIKEWYEAVQPVLIESSIPEHIGKGLLTIAGYEQSQIDSVRFSLPAAED